MAAGSTWGRTSGAATTTMRTSTRRKIQSMTCSGGDGCAPGLGQERDPARRAELRLQHPLRVFHELHEQQACFARVDDVLDLEGMRRAEGRGDGLEPRFDLVAALFRVGRAVDLAAV